MSNDSSISSGNDDNLAAIASPVIGSPSTLNPIMNLNTLLTKKYIDLSYQGLNDTNIDILIDVLNANSTCLKQLNLYGNRLTLTNAHLAIALGACTSLTVLSLGDNNIGPDGAANIANHIIAVTTSLVELHLGDNHISDVGTTSIAKALCNNDTIQLLGLYDNQIGDVGAVSLALANTTISTAPTDTASGTSSTTNTNTTVLREIWLHNNHIGNVGGKAIVEALRNSNSMDAAAVKNSSVENIFLMNNKISSDINTDIRKVLADRKKKMMTPATTAPVMMAEEVVVVETKKEEEEVSAADAAALPRPTSPTSGALFHNTTTSNSNAPVPPSSPTAEQVALVVREALSRDVLNTLKTKDLEIIKLSTALELERERSLGKDVEIAALKVKVMEMTAELVAVVDAVTPPPVLLSPSASLMNDELPFIVENVSLKDTSTAVAVADYSNSEEEDARDETEENSNNDTLHITVSVE